mgnify:FL=1
MTFVPAAVGDDGSTYVPDVAYALAARNAKGVSKLEGQTTLVATEVDVAGALSAGGSPGWDSRSGAGRNLVVSADEDAKAYAMQTVFEKANGRGVVPEVAFTIDGASHQAVGIVPDERFWTKVNRDGPLIVETPCWEWTAQSVDGYGRIWVDGNMRMATHVAWYLETGEWPADLDLQALHRCDNPPCVRFSHLFLGTNVDNVNDARSKNRIPQGTHRPGVKLTEEQVLEIFHSSAPQRTLVEQFGVSVGTVAAIKTGQKWSHLTRSVVGVLGERHSHALTGEQGFDASEDGTGRGTPIVTIEVEGVHGDIAHTLGCGAHGQPGEDGTGRGTPVVAIRTSDTKANGVGIQEEAAYTLQRGNGQAVAFGELDTPREDGTPPPLRTAAVEDEHPDAKAFVTSQQMNGFYADRDVSYTIPAQPPSDGSNLQYGVQYEEPSPVDTVVGPLSANGGTEHKHGYGMGQQDYEITDTVVRRLTPVECMRLQGFPDDWTCLCDQVPCKCADGPQYKAAGNAVTVSVIQYLGGRIVAFEREAGRL